MNAITITENGGELTITIKGDAYDTLQRMSDAMNEWSVNGEEFFRRDKRRLRPIDIANVTCYLTHQLGRQILKWRGIQVF